MDFAPSNEDRAADARIQNPSGMSPPIAKQSLIQTQIKTNILKQQTRMASVVCVCFLLEQISKHRTWGGFVPEQQDLAH